MNKYQAIKDMIYEEFKDLFVSEEFKYFSMEAYVIFFLCNIYEKGRKELITIESLNDKLNVLEFINDIRHIVDKLLGVKIEQDRKIQKSLITDVYIPHVRQLMMSN